MPTTSTPDQTQVILLAERACDDAALTRIAAAVRGRNVRVVSPAGRIAGERWLVDVSSREQDALERMHGWTAALAPYAAGVEGEIGDENPRLALADTRREIGDALVLSVGASTTSPVVSRPAARRAAPGTRRLVTRRLAA